MTNERAPKAADITDAAVLDIVADLSHAIYPPWSKSDASYGHPVDRWSIEKRLPAYPGKVVLAKLRSMVKRGVLDGCACGCRGDFISP